MRPDSDPDTTAPPPKMLLDLPPEILEHILLRLDASSFSVILMTCKTIRSTVQSSSKLIHSQLLRLPGLRVQPDHGPEEREEMLLNFCARAKQHAFNGVDVFCDSIVYTPVGEDWPTLNSPHRKVSPYSHLWTSPKLSLLQSTTSGLFSALVDPDANIHIYKIVEGQVSPRGILLASVVNMDAGCLSSRGKVFFSVAALAFQKCYCSAAQPPHIVALYKYHVTPAPPGQNQRFVQDAVDTAKKRLKLVVWKICQGDLKVPTVRDVDLRNMNPADVGLKSNSWADQPVTLVTSDYPLRRTQSPPISLIFRCGSGRAVRYHMRTCFYDRDIDGTALGGLTKRADGFANADVSQHLDFTKPFYKVEGRFGKELLFYTEDVVPSHRIADCTSNARGADIVEAIAQTVSGDILNPVVGVYRGIPIAIYHHHHCGKLSDGSKYCINSLLQIVFPRNGTKGAYLLKGVETTDPCRQRSLDGDFSPMEHVFVAKLMGLDSPSTSPLKRIVAVSKSKRRIAIADWDVVKLYAVEPDAFLHKTIGSLEPGTRSTCVSNSYKAFKAEEPADDDEAYTVRTAHGYYHSYLRIQGHKKRLVALEPTELPSRGVVYSLEFQSNSELWAFTDTGLVKWYWGEGRTGNRESRHLGPAHSQPVF